MKGIVVRARRVRLLESLTEGGGIRYQTIGESGDFDLRLRHVSRIVQAEGDAAIVETLPHGPVVVEGLTFAEVVGALVSDRRALLRLCTLPELVDAFEARLSAIYWSRKMDRQSDDGELVRALIEAILEGEVERLEAIYNPNGGDAQPGRHSGAPRGGPRI